MKRSNLHERPPASRWPRLALQPPLSGMKATVPNVVDSGISKMLSKTLRQAMVYRCVSAVFSLSMFLAISAKSQSPPCPHPTHCGCEPCPEPAPGSSKNIQQKVDQTTAIINGINADVENIKKRNEAEQKRIENWVAEKRAEPAPPASRPRRKTQAGTDNASSPTINDAAVVPDNFHPGMPESDARPAPAESYPSLGSDQEGESPPQKTRDDEEQGAATKKATDQAATVYADRALKSSDSFLSPGDPSAKGTATTGFLGGDVSPSPTRFLQGAGLNNWDDTSGGDGYALPQASPSDLLEKVKAANERLLPRDPFGISDGGSALLERLFENPPPAAPVLIMLLVPSDSAQTWPSSTSAAQQPVAPAKATGPNSSGISPGLLEQDLNQGNSFKKP